MKPTYSEFQQYYSCDSELRKNPTKGPPQDLITLASARVDSMCRSDYANPYFIDHYTHQDGTTQGLYDFFAMIDSNEDVKFVWKEFCTLSPSEMGAAIKIMLLMA